MSSVTPIYIPTHARERVLTYENLPEQLRRRVTLVIAAAHRIHWHDTYPDLNLLTTNQQGKGAATVKQYIYSTCVTPCCILLDDDLKFQEAHWEVGKKRFRKASEQGIVQAFADLEVMSKSPGVAWTSFSTPFFNSYKTYWVSNKRMAHSFFINTGLCRRAGASFAGIPTMSDVKFVMECYEAGCTSLTCTDFAAIDISQRGVGGESDTGESRRDRFATAIEYLTARWPKYVRVRDASNNSRHMESIGYEKDISFYPYRICRDAKLRKAGI